MTHVAVVAPTEGVFGATGIEAVEVTLRGKMGPGVAPPLTMITTDVNRGARAAVPLYVEVVIQVRLGLDRL
jgi:hypothetical protein